MLADLTVIMNRKIPTYVPAGVVAQVWRGSARQHGINVLFQSRCVHIESLDDGIARQLGLLLGAAGSSDVTDAHVALCAINRAATVYTSDPADIRALAPQVRFRPV
jgi:hypothetical protein